MRRSITVFPRLSDKEVSAVVETRKQYARAFNMSAECLINNSKSVLLFLQDSYSVQGMLLWKLSRHGM